MLRTTIVVALFGSAWFAGCDRRSDQYRSSARQAPIVLNVVARAGGSSIAAAEVANLMASESISAEAAVQELIDDALLVQEAERMGFTEGREGERVVERLMVRAMLHDLEEENTPETISAAEVRADYAQYADKFQVPERRRSWHILVKDSGDAGKALAESILRQIRQAKDPRSVYELYAQGGLEGTEIEVTAEDLPAITTDAKIEQPYKKALFAAKSEGALETVVKTSHGWHAIVLAEIRPAERRTLDEVEDEIRARLSQKKRFEKVVDIVQGLEARGLVRYDQRGVERLLSMPGLPERAQ
ncbi:MAG: peptidylprolyl isomerase [Polyangiales bacterium]